MSWKASAYVKRLATAPNGKKVTRSEKLLLLVIADYYNDSYRCAWPKINDLAGEVMLSPRRVRELQRSCEEKGVITISERKAENGSSDTNEIRFPVLEEDAETRKGEGAKSRRGVNTESQGGAAGDRRGGLRNGGEPYKEEPPCKPPADNRHAAAAAASSFDLQICLAYAMHLKATRVEPKIASPARLAKWFFENGGADEEIRDWLKQREAEKAAAAAAQCPCCHGKGVWIDPEADWMGVQKCDHPALVADG